MFASGTFLSWVILIRSEHCPPRLDKLDAALTFFWSLGYFCFSFDAWLVLCDLDPEDEVFKKSDIRPVAAKRAKSGTLMVCLGVKLLLVKVHRSY